jgi:prepilin-type processing-associated H-X9-DG protein
MLVVEASGDVPWTRPEDLPYSADKPLPRLGGVHEGGFNAALADGSVQFREAVKTLEDERRVRAMITHNGGEAAER